MNILLGNILQQRFSTKSNLFGMKRIACDPDEDLRTFASKIWKQMLICRFALVIICDFLSTRAISETKTKIADSDYSISIKLARISAYTLSLHSREDSARFLAQGNSNSGY